jgi:putative MATE family efflux protein
MTSKVEELEKEKIGSLIASYSIPAIIGMVVMASYNIVDRIFVGRGVGTDAITAIAITFPVNIVIIGFGQLIGMGSMALISITLGQKKKEEAERILGNAFSLVILISLSISTLIYFTMSPLLSILGGVGVVHNLALQYLSVVILGIPFQFVTFSLNGIIRAEGSPKMALVTILISGILNTIFNPIFIFLFHMGIRGSALATVIAQFIGAIWVISYFSGKRSYLNLKQLSFDPKIVWRIFSIGVSPLIMQVAGSFITFIFNKTLFTYGGNLAIAVMGIGSSFIMLIMMPLYGLNQGLQPIIGYNYGARQIGRVLETLRKGIIIATSVCVVGFLAAMFFSTAIISLFNSDDEELIRLGARALKIVLLMLPIYGFQVVSWAYFQAVGKPKQSIILTTTKQILFVIPLILILPHFFGLDGVWMAAPIADFLAACLAGVLLFVELKRLRDLENEPIVDVSQVHAH